MPDALLHSITPTFRKRALTLDSLRSRNGHATWCGTLAGFALLCLTNASFAETELPPELGYNYGESETPRTMALGGAQRATSYSVGGLFMNPANMARTQIYHLGGFSEIWPEAKRVSFGGAAVDSIVNTKGLAGGVGYTWNQQDKDTLDRQYNDLRFALALPLQNKFFLGLGGRYLWLAQDGDGPLGESLASGGLEEERIIEGFSFDAGVTIKPTDSFYIAVVGNNLSDPGNGFQPLTAGGGLGFATNDFGIEGDVVFDFTTWDETTVRYMGGAEYLAGGSVPIRVGYRYDTGLEAHAVSAGVGYTDRSFSADVAARRYLGGDEATAIVLGLTLHLETSGLTPTPSNEF